jgi:hypothetical protein
VQKPRLRLVLSCIVLHALTLFAVQTGHFTLDNAGNNHTAMQELSSLLGQCGIDFDPVENRIPCFPHVINICVKHILDEYATADYSAVADTWTIEDLDIQKVDYVQAVQAKPLERARHIVRLVCASHQRRDRFHDTIIRGNEEGWFHDENGDAIRLPVVELLLDEPTRWDSSYVMVNRMRTLEQVRLHIIKHMS